MGEIESQIADLETFVDRKTRQSKPWMQFWTIISAVACSIPLCLSIWRIPASHQADIDKAVFVVFGSGHKSLDSQRPGDTVTVRREKLTSVLEEHLTSDLAVVVGLLALGTMWFFAFLCHYTGHIYTKHLVQSVRIIKQLQDQSNTAETT